VAKNRELADLLEYFVNYLTQSLEQYYEEPGDIDHQVTLIHEVLRHDAVLFVLEPDSTYGYRVNKVGSEAVRENAIKPALRLLKTAQMPDALHEYEEALVHWAKGEQDDAILPSIAWESR